MASERKGPAGLPARPKVTVQDLIESEAQQAEDLEALSDPEAPLPAHVRVTRGRGRSRVLQVRLNDEELQRLEARAEARYVPVSTLARAMLLEAMDSGEADD